MVNKTYDKMRYIHVSFLLSKKYPARMFLTSSQPGIEAIFPDLGTWERNFQGLENRPPDLLEIGLPPNTEDHLNLPKTKRSENWRDIRASSQPLARLSARRG